MSPGPFCCDITMRKMPLMGKGILTRHWICWHHNLGIPSLLNYKIYCKGYCKCLLFIKHRGNSILTSLVAQTVKNLTQMQETWVHFLGLPDSGGGHGNPLHYSWLKKPMERGAWWATVHGITKSQTPLSNFCTYVE